jgi:hypothetical protein
MKQLAPGHGKFKTTNVLPQVTSSQSAKLNSRLASERWKGSALPLQDRNWRAPVTEPAKKD